jgi:hypothetical protein
MIEIWIGIILIIIGIITAGHAFFALPYYKAKKRFWSSGILVIIGIGLIVASFFI